MCLLSAESGSVFLTIGSADKGKVGNDPEEGHVDDGDVPVDESHLYTHAGSASTNQGIRWSALLSGAYHT